MPYRTGRHWGVTIVREGDTFTQGRMEPDGPVLPPRREGDQLVAVVTNGDTALAELICALLNGEQPTNWVAFAQQQVAQMQAEASAPDVIHEIRDGEAMTHCCRRTPFELPRADGHRLTVHEELATCPGREARP